MYTSLGQCDGVQHRCTWDQPCFFSQPNTQAIPPHMDLLWNVTVFWIRAMKTFHSTCMTADRNNNNNNNNNTLQQRPRTAGWRLAECAVFTWGSLGWRLGSGPCPRISCTSPPPSGWWWKVWSRHLSSGSRRRSSPTGWRASRRTSRSRASPRR